ncbi:MAG: hypothetical protein IJA55_04550 [Clostridia bacterium]|nr:hypothetical protein [Clostridia bacterium]
MFIFVIICIISFLCGIGSLLIYLVFKYRPDLTAGTFATRKSYKHKKDVIIRKKHGRDAYFKNITKSVYVYTVNGKEYRVRDISPTIPGETQRMLGIRYIKAFPRLAHTEKELISTELIRLCISMVVFINSLCCIFIFHR